MAGEDQVMLRVAAVHKNILDRIAIPRWKFQYEYKKGFGPKVGVVLP